MITKKLLEWSIRSSVNVAAIREYIASENPTAAGTVLAEIRKSAYSLREFPMHGHTGRRAGTRELVLPKYPYTIIYRLTSTKVIIVAVMHQAQKHKKSF